MISFQWIMLSFLLVSGALFAYLIPPEKTYFRNDCHAGKQCRFAECVKDAWTLFHTYDPALRTCIGPQYHGGHAGRGKTDFYLNICDGFASK